ncbi:MAG: UDP-N-acetylmuramoyl-L-alanyl-D-glutamate--2,6-diaminopimelate ligase [Candidatus Saccharibacteria bacterium]|uniref:UDP-N-acetylmuramoyl-L-alanyl-D-glutamate--2, 6-diaminopimelate ligase n=1 Tax=Candidatus Nanosyncoccus alces TaxID=2171997 RepID=A0ABY0FM66_9BACT|nr:UDP-N-acetylmuramoyl-L-alanyl-D-glutamate--2,6-diaminopimelate ligase [Candidatus Nanosyncoccus alces]MDO4399229.1 UDP-N-acetylmuramoyl-L-alanyl-D-glutamate--2,6-diaminopimelate ligase [Candidatus Saccharibacteria bacterium]RYC74974.1 UDP-N-acetylmuramoyl-L-alanyl-D-glutamate--2,6-diaminopimelate ligase [Candidatus Nanosyncoccus alces]
MKQLLEKLPFYNQAVLPYHFAQSAIAGVKYHFPGKNLRVIGITGTNGKTTTAFMVWQMLNHAGFKTGLMTTVAWGVNKLKPELGHMTTVDAFTLNSRIADIKNQGAEFLVLEVTSHALAQFRTLGIPIEIAVFTNLTHDHLDYHKTLTKYRAAKGKLFKKAKFSILNADDSATKYYQTLAQEYTTYGIKSGQNRAESLKLTVNGVKYSLGDINIETKIPGEFNVYNSMAAALVGQKLGLTPKQIHDGIKSLEAVEGRMNIIDEGQPFTVIVDYAHAPDALEKVFDSVKDHKGRIISVHGGAGRRDSSTRPIRGAILAQHSDIVIITEDDSRDEDPEAIAAGFIKGAEKHGKVIDKDLFKELDRGKAIALAIKMAKKGDLVLILGKGHEKTILRADGPHDFEDIKVAQKLLKARS